MTKVSVLRPTYSFAVSKVWKITILSCFCRCFTYCCSHDFCFLFWMMFRVVFWFDDDDSWLAIIISISCPLNPFSVFKSWKEWINSCFYYCFSCWCSHDYIFLVVISFVFNFYIEQSICSPARTYLVTNSWP